MRENTFRQYLVRETYKAFEIVKERNNVTLSKLLKEMRIDVSFGNKFVKFPQDAMVKAILFTKLKRIKSQSKFTKYLESHKEDSLNLGFCIDENNKLSVPNQRTISYFLNHILDKETIDIIDSIAKKIEELTEKYSIDFGEVFHAERIETQNTDQPNDNLGDKKTEVCRLSREILLPSIGFLYMRKNCKWKKSDYVKFLTRMAHSRGFAESCQQDAEQDNILLPNADSLFYHMKKWEENPDVLKQMFIRVFDRLLETTKRRTNLLHQRKVNLAIDYSEIRYFGDRADRMVVGRGKKDPEGTKWCHKYLTLSIAHRDVKYILLTLPTGIFTNEQAALTEMLNFAKKRFNIGYILMDRYFSQKASCLELLDKLGLSYVLIAKRTATVKRIIDMTSQMPYPHAVPDVKLFQNSDIKTNLIIVKGRKEKDVPFITNAKLDDIETDTLTLAHRIDAIYRSRWNIEDAFNKVKQFLPKTTSKSPLIRYFYFLFSSCLYNLWILATALLSIFVHGRVVGERLMKELIFIKRILNQLDPT